MNKFTEEEAFAVFENIIDLLEGKPMTLVLQVLANVVSSTCENVSPQQKAAIVMVMLDAMGIDGAEEATVQ